MDNNKVFVVLMRRWGDNEGHHYIDGVFTCLADAFISGEQHSLFRDKKYIPYFEEQYINSKSGKSFEISYETARDYAKMKYPQKFDDRNQLIEESGE